MKPSRIFALFCVYSMFSPFAVAAQGIAADNIQLWAKDAGIAVMSFGFEDFDEKKLANRKYFTAHGYESFYKAMEKSKIPQAVRKDKLILKADLQCAPEVKAIPGGQQTWQVTFPLRIEYISKDKISTQMQNITAMIVPEQTLAGQQIGIDQWIAVPMSDAQASVCGDKEQTKARIGELRREIADRQAEIKRLEGELSAP